MAWYVDCEYEASVSESVAGSWASSRPPSFSFSGRVEEEG